LLRERARTIASSATTTCLPTISGAASIRISLASLTSSAFKPILDAHASSKASAWNTLRSDTASAGLPPAVPAPETGAGCVNARCATAAGIARRSRGSIRLREPDANPLDRGESASRARATASARVVGPGNRGIGLCRVSFSTFSRLFAVPQIELRVRCHERPCELCVRVATRRRLHEDPRRVNHPLVRYHTAPVVPHYPAFVPDQLSESERRARDYSVHCAKSQRRHQK
jgi:hypothetical protein